MIGDWCKEIVILNLNFHDHEEVAAKMAGVAEGTGYVFEAKFLIGGKCIF